MAPAGGGTPFGIIRDQHGIIRRCEKESRILDEIWRRCALGETYAEIAYALNVRGLKKRDGKPWTRAAVARLCNKTSKIRERMAAQRKALETAGIAGGGA